MKNGFEIDNPFFTFMGALADVVILNILFVICSIPIVTMGASMSAMYQTIQKMREGRMPSVFSYFLKEFRGSAKKSLPAWMLQLVTGALLFFDLSFVGMMPKTAVWNTIGMVIGGLLLLWMMMSCYLMPAALYDGKKVRPALTQSLYLAVRNLPYTMVMVVLNSIPFVCLLLGAYYIGRMMPIYLTAGFGVTAYLNTMMLEKCRDLVRVQD